MSTIIPDIHTDEFFVEAYDRCTSATMTSIERMYALYQSVAYLVMAKVPGDFVECGVWKGGSVMMIAQTLLYLGATDRKIVLFDTFEGMTPPTIAMRTLRDSRRRRFSREGIETRTYFGRTPRSISFAKTFRAPVIP